MLICIFQMDSEHESLEQETKLKLMTQELELQVNCIFRNIFAYVHVEKNYSLVKTILLYNTHTQDLKNELSLICSHFLSASFA